jgi:hypothetical protein
MSQFMEFRRKLADLIEWAEDAGGMDYQEINQALAGSKWPDSHRNEDLAERMRAALGIELQSVS